MMKSPLLTILSYFICWKLLLLLIAVCSPGPGYDTSTTLLLKSLHSTQSHKLPSSIQYLLSKLIRWDAIYFVKVSNRNYLYEQEWAFGWGFTRIIHFGTVALEFIGIPHYDGLEGLVGVVLAHISHLLSTIVLYNLSSALFSSKRFALMTSLLHIISPAGIFLSAPFAESSCALLTFSGIYLFTRSFASGNDNRTFGHDILILMSGISFGIATTLRSNGLLNGLLLLEEAFRLLVSLGNEFQLSSLRRLIITGLGGICTAIGFLLPQYLAYQEYCAVGNNESVRPWCGNTLPSIYTFVQEYYWNCGLWRYWTLSNAPLFVLAAPMITIMITSGIWGLQTTTMRQDSKQTTQNQLHLQRPQVLRNLAASQLLLTMITLTSAHVQIITRISSSYPTCLWYLAASLVGNEGSSLLKTGPRMQKWLSVTNVGRFMVVYAVIQSGLFSSFLPPA